MFCTWKGEDPDLIDSASAINEVVKILKHSSIEVVED
jgi:hypothetical protein